MPNEESEKPVVNLPAKDLPIEPITLQEIDEETKKRVSLIDHEFKRGFDFIKNQPKSVTFFGSARFGENNEHYKRSERIAARLSGLGFAILTGGGPGIMEAANRGAFEAEGRSLGLNIKLPHEQARNPYLTDSLDFYYFFTRKVMLTFSAEAYLFFPGGFGTFDEFFEILTLVQTKKIERVPLILVGTDFWKPLQHFMEEYMLNNNGTIDKEDMSFFTITQNEDEIVDIIKNVSVRNGVRFSKNI